MTGPDRDRAARTTVQGLLRADKVKALTVAVLVASSSVAGCTAAPRNQPCPGQPDSAPCIQPSGETSGWLSQPRWPAEEGAEGGPQGLHLATSEDFAANPQYTQMRAGDSTGHGGPTYYGGGHYVRVYGGSSGFSGDGGGGGGGASS